MRSDKAMTVVLVSNSTWNIFNFRMPVIQALSAAGYRIVLIAPVDESVGMLRRQSGIEIVPLRHLNRDSRGVWNNFRLLLECIRLYRRIRPDLVLHFTIKPNIFGNLAAAVCKIHSICVVTGLGYTFLHKGLLQQLTQALYRISFRFASKVIFENKEDCTMLTGRNLVTAGKTEVIPGCGVDIRHFCPNGKHPAHGSVVFTFIGRLLLDKGIREFVAAARLVRAKWPQAEFWIVGGLDNDNPAHIDRGTLLEWVQCGDVQYKGVTDDVRPYIASSDWIVLPSYREGLSRVLLEAMAMSKPLITTDTAGCRETVEEGKNGYLVPVQDTLGLAEVIGRCCGLSKSRTEEMGAYGRQKAIREFESGLVGDAYLDIIQKVIPFDLIKSNECNTIM